MLVRAIGKAHGHLVFERRVEVLVDKLGALVRPGSHLLDVGTGDGRIAALVAARQPGTRVEGIDVLLRPETHIPVRLFDGARIPFEDKSVDIVSFVDVLHHTPAPEVLLREAARVAREAVLVKDHLSETALDHGTLRFMDWIGNAPHGVVLPYNYASRRTWEGWFRDVHLDVESFDTDVPLYAFPFSLVFGRRLHFVARLRPAEARPAA